MYPKSTQVDFKGQPLFIGIDVHLRNWTVSIRTKDLHLRTFSMDPSPDRLHQHLAQNYPGAEYHGVYEAGFCGFWIHRELAKRGVHANDFLT